MPPKIVYGKKRPIAPQQPSFTKFISPEKDGSLGQKLGEAESCAAQRSRPEERRKDVTYDSEPEENQDNVDILEQNMRNLCFEHGESEQEGSMKRKNKPLENHHGKERKLKGHAVAIVESLELDFEGLQIDYSPQPDDYEPAKRARPRKVLQDRGASNLNRVEEDSRSPCRDMLELENMKKSKQAAGTQTRKPTGVKKLQTAQPRRTSPRKKTRLPTPEPTPPPEDLLSAHVSSLLPLGDRKKIISFAEWSTELEPHFTVTKIAEASYSEVYRLSATPTSDGLKQESVLKVVALKTPPFAPLPCQLSARSVRDRDAQVAKELAQREENDYSKSKVADVLSEVKLLQNLNHIPGFTVFRDLTIVQGRPSAAFNKAWSSWNKLRPRGKKSEFPDPSKKPSYDDLQLWAVIEMQDAGTDCEKLMELGGLTSIWEVWDVFWGVCLSVAKAEEASRFEHRDLHLGNVCVRSSRAGGDLLQASVHHPLQRRIRFTGFETTVIDYTLSRADIVSASSRRSSAMSTISNSTSSSEFARRNTDVAYLDLDKEPTLFQGDATEEYQYEIYRYMRNVVLYNNPLQSTSIADAEPKTPRCSPRKKCNHHIRFDDKATESPRRSPRKAVPMVDPTSEESVWGTFHPRTNLVWAHLILHKLLEHMATHGTEPGTLSSGKLLANMQLHDGDDTEKVKRRAVKLHEVLKMVGKLLCPTQLGKEEALGSVKELIVLALEKRWLRVGDVDAC